MSGFDKSLRMRWLIERGWTEAPYDERLGPYRLLPPSWLVIPGKTFYVYDAQDIHERVMDEYFADEARDRKEAGSPDQIAMSNAEWWKLNRRMEEAEGE